MKQNLRFKNRKEYSKLSSDLLLKKATQLFPVVAGRLSNRVVSQVLSRFSLDSFLDKII